MGSVTDGWVRPPGGFYLDFGTGTPSGAASGSVTDGPYIMPNTGYAPAPAAPAHGWWDTPPAAAAPPPAAAAPPPAAAAPPPDAGPGPAPFVPNPIDPGHALVPQPTTLGNALGNAVLNPPQQFWVGGVDSYPKQRSSGRMTTTQT